MWIPVFIRIHIFPIPFIILAFLFTFIPSHKADPVSGNKLILSFPTTDRRCLAFLWREDTGPLHLVDYACTM